MDEKDGWVDFWKLVEPRSSMVKCGERNRREVSACSMGSTVVQVFIFFIYNGYMFHSLPIKHSRVEFAIVLLARLGTSLPILC